MSRWIAGREQTTCREETKIAITTTIAKTTLIIINLKSKMGPIYSNLPELPRIPCQKRKEGDWEVGIMKK